MDISKEQIDNINKDIKNLEKRIGKLEELKISVTNQPNPTTATEKKISIKEFLLSLKRKGEVETTLAIAYYFDKFKQMENINKKDLQNGFQESKEKFPLNINDKVNMNIRKGYMAESQDKKNGLKSWYITNSGESHINELKNN